MIIVVFFSKGMMGDKEFSWQRIFDFFHKLFHGKKQAVEEVSGNE